MKGMLWMDDDKKTTLAQKVQRAAEYYQRKYGRTPTVCLVNPKALSEETSIAGITVKPNRPTLPDYFLIGVGEG